MAKAREITAILPAPSIISHGRHSVDGYFIIGQEFDARKVDCLNQLPEFRQLVVKIDENKNPYVSLTYLKSVAIRDLKHGRLYPDCNFIIGLRRPDSSLKAFRCHGHNDSQVQELVDFINRFSFKSC